MNSQELNALLSKIDLVKFIAYTSVQVLKKNGSWLCYCPFHDDDEIHALFIYPEKKKMKCAICDFEGTAYDFIKKKFGFQNGDGIEYLKKYLEESQIKTDKNYDIGYKDAHELNIHIEDRTYQITNANLKQLNNFQMTLRLSYNKEFPYFEQVNLVRRSARDVFVRGAKEHFYLDEKIIENDLRIIMEAVSKIQSDYIKQEEAELMLEQKPFILSADEETKALDLLSNKDIITELLLLDLERLGYAGDERAKEVLYISSTSRKLVKPINVLCLAPFSTGKSFGVKMIFSLIPHDEKRHYGRLSTHALSYFKRKELMNMAFAVDEYSSIDIETLSQLRQLLSEGRTSTGVSSLNKMSGDINTLSKEVLGPIAMFLSATHSEIDEETLSRFLELAILDTIEQNKKVIESLKYQDSFDAFMDQPEKEEIMRKYQCMQKMLKKVHIIIPDDILKKINFPTAKNEHKRLFIFFMSMIKSYALHRQYQRKKYKEQFKNGEIKYYMYVEKRDVLDSVRLMKDLFKDGLSEIGPLHKKALKDMQDYCIDKIKNNPDLSGNEVYFSRSDIWHFRPSWNQRTLRTVFEKLLLDEYIVRVVGVNRSRHYYKLNLSKQNPFNSIELDLWNE